MDTLEKIYLSTDLLVPDPLNDEAFEEGALTDLKASIQKEGFLGDIVAYPIEEGKYRIESGHRRWKAARNAGVEKVLVSLSSPPENMEERRRRLVRWNLHARPSTPLGMAKLAQFLFETYEMKNRRRREAGEKPEPILEKIASDLECSKANVSKYRMLLSLNENLQALIRDGTCPWAPLSAASSLSAEQQDMLYRRILGECRLTGKVRSIWLDKEIREFKQFGMENRTVRFSLPADARKETQQRKSAANVQKKENIKNPPKRIRRNDGFKGIRKSKNLIAVSLSEKAFIHGKDTEHAVKMLREIREQIDHALKQYEETGTLQ